MGAKAGVQVLEKFGGRAAEPHRQARRAAVRGDREPHPVLLVVLDHEGFLTGRRVTGQRPVPPSGPLLVAHLPDHLAGGSQRADRDGESDTRLGAFGGGADPRPGRPVHAEGQHGLTGAPVQVGAGAERRPVTQVPVAGRQVSAAAGLAHRGVGQFAHLVSVAHPAAR